VTRVFSDAAVEGARGGMRLAMRCYARCLTTWARPQHGSGNRSEGPYTSFHTPSCNAVGAEAALCRLSMNVRSDGLNVCEG
jgi:hypothetical protein